MATPAIYWSQKHGIQKVAQSAGAKIPIYTKEPLFVCVCSHTKLPPRSETKCHRKLGSARLHFANAKTGGPSTSLMAISQ